MVSLKTILPNSDLDLLKMVVDYSSFTASKPGREMLLRSEQNKLITFVGKILRRVSETCGEMKLRENGQSGKIMNFNNYI